MARREDYDIVISATDATGAAVASAQRNMLALNGAVGTLRGGVDALAAVFAGKEVVDFARDAVSSLSDIGSSAKRVGVTTDALQALRFQASQGGGDLKDADAALQRFADTASKAGTGGGYLAKVFQLNGIALKDQNGNLRAASDLLVDYARLVDQVASPQVRLRLAVEVFGKNAGPQMVAVLEQIARQGLPGVIDTAQKAGVVIDAALIDKADEIDRKWKATSQRFDAFMKGTIIAGLEEVEKFPRDGSPLAGFLAYARGGEWSISIDLTPQSGSLVDQLWQMIRPGAAALLGEPKTSFASRFGAMQPPTIDTKNWAEATGDYLKLVDAANKAGEEISRAFGKKPVLPLDNDALQKQIDTITRHVAAMQADAASVDASAGEHEALRVRMQLVEVAQQHGIPVAGDYAKKIDDIANRARDAAQGLALAKLQSDTLFQRAQIGRDSDEQQIAARLRAIYGAQYVDELNGAIASQMRLNAYLQQTHDIGQDAFKGMLSDLRQGKTLSEAFGNAGLNALGKIADKLAEMAYNNLWTLAFGGSGGLFGGLLSGLLGGGGGAAMGGATKPGFALGGWTGNMSPTAIAGFVHGREYVFDADSTAAIGVPALEAIRRGARGYADGGFVAPAPTLAIPDFGPGRGDSGGSSAFNFAPVYQIDARGSQMTEDQFTKLLDQNNKKIIKALPSHIAAFNRDPRAR